MLSKDTYTLKVIVDGSGTIQTPTKRLAMSAGDVVFYWQGYSYEWWTHPKDLLQHYWIDFEGPLAKTMFQTLRLTPTECVLPRPFVPDREIACFDELISHLDAPQPVFPWKCMALLFELWHSVTTSTVTTDLVNGSRHIAQRARMFIETHYAEDIGIDDIASFVNVTPEYLTGLFRREHGVTPYDYVIECRLNAAERLLKKGATVKDAAASVGYLDASYFSRLFRRKRGTTPTNIRRQKS